VRLEQLWALNQRVRAEDAAERMSHENAVRDGAITRFHPRDEFVRKKLEQAVGVGILVLLAPHRIAAPGGIYSVRPWPRVTGAPTAVCASHRCAHADDAAPSVSTAHRIMLEVILFMPLSCSQYFNRKAPPCAAMNQALLKTSKARAEISSPLPLPGEVARSAGEGLATLP
jgi:hypothetical protein